MKKVVIGVLVGIVAVCIGIGYVFRDEIAVLETILFDHPVEQVTSEQREALLASNEDKIIGSKFTFEGIGGGDFPDPAKGTVFTPLSYDKGAEGVVKYEETRRTKEGSSEKTETTLSQQLYPFESYKEDDKQIYTVYFLLSDDKAPEIKAAIPKLTNDGHTMFYHESGKP